MGIYSSRSGLILGFHGCEREVCQRVVRGIEPLFFHRNSYDWLGNGYYFWENNLERAWDYARNPPGGRRYKEPAVLGAVIDLEYCLDLLDTDGINAIRISYTTFKDTFERTDRVLPENQKVQGSPDLLLRHLDCAVVENLHETRRKIAACPFDTVRGMFPEGNELYPNAGFKDKNHIQICVRNPNCIKGYFIPRIEVKWPFTEPASGMVMPR